MTKGLVRKSSAPSRKPVSRSSTRSDALTNMMGMSLIARSRRVMAKPSGPSGSFRSTSATDGRNSVTLLWMAVPFDSVRT